MTKKEPVILVAMSLIWESAALSCHLMGASVDVMTPRTRYDSPPIRSVSRSSMAPPARPSSPVSVIAVLSRDERALHDAVDSGDHDAALVLLGRAVNVNAKDSQNFNRTPIFLAKTPAMVDLLRRFGADWSVTDDLGNFAHPVSQNGIQILMGRLPHYVNQVAP